MYYTVDGGTTMLDTEYECLLKFVEAVFKAEMGTDEHAYLRLRQLADSMHVCPDHAERSHRIEEIIERIDAADGGFYLPTEPTDDLEHDRRREEELIYGTRAEQEAVDDPINKF